MKELMFQISFDLWQVRASVSEVATEKGGEWFKILELVNEALNRCNSEAARNA